MHCHARLCFKMMLDERRTAGQGGEHVCKALVQCGNISSLGLYEMVVAMEGGGNGAIWYFLPQLISLLDPAHQRRSFSLSPCFKEVEMTNLCGSLSVQPRDLIVNVPHSLCDHKGPLPLGE